MEQRTKMESNTTSNSVVVCKRHVELPTQQRRIRHVRGIAVRNLPLHHSELSEAQLYFTLHLNNKTKCFYTSDKVLGCSNPNWRPFDLSMLSEEVDLSSNFLLVKVWHICGGERTLLIQWDTNLTGLEYITDKSQADDISYPDNTIVFWMFGCYLTAPPQDNSLPSDVTKCLMKVEHSAIKHSYSVNSMSRLRTVMRAIKQTQATVENLRSDIEQRLTVTKKTDEKKSAREMTELRIRIMREDLQWRICKLQTEKDNYEAKQNENHQRDMDLKKKFQTLQKDKARLHEKKKGYFDVREDLIKTGAHLVVRRKQLISELSLIYPVIEIADTSRFAVCGVHLPNSEDFAGVDEVPIMVALGYTCHLVQQVCSVLDVPARYPMEHRGSRSMIHDHILGKLAEKDRDFPLFSKGREKFQFNYGVYLLNRNISQLRFYCGMGTTDLRATLPNLKSLLELRLGVKYTSTNNLLSTYIPLPPNLGGPQQAFVPELNYSELDVNVDVNVKDKHESFHNSQKSPRKQHSASAEDLLSESSQQTFSSTHVNGSRGSNSSGNLHSLEKHSVKSASEQLQCIQNNKLGEKTEQKKILADLKDKIECLDDCDGVNSNDECPTFSQIYENKFKHWQHNEQSGGAEKSIPAKLASGASGTVIDCDDNTFKTSAMGKQHRRTKSDQYGNDLCQQLSYHRSQSSHIVTSGVAVKAGVPSTQDAGLSHSTDNL